MTTAIAELETASLEVRAVIDARLGGGNFAARP
jgi:hypothetical protein